MITRVIFSFIIVLGLAATSVGHAREENTVKGAIAFNPVATVALVEYERLLSRNLALGARVGVIDYDFDDGSYNETGDGNGVEVLVRFYPQGNGFKGFYVGAGLGLWSVDWAWTDPNDTPNRGSGSTDSTNVNVGVGWKLGGGKVYFEPAIILGNWLGGSKDSTGTKESELGFYFAVSLGVGVKF